MTRLLRSPLLRICVGLVLVTISALLLSDMLGFMPDTKRAQFSSRKAIAESLAVQFSMDIANRQVATVQETLQQLVERNGDLQSAAIRRQSGDLIAEFGGHRQFWKLQPGDKSTTSQIQVPLFDRKGVWGTVELSFVDGDEGKGFFPFRNSFPAVIILVGLCGFFGYWIFLKRALRELDPSAVIPERVRMALDTLSEGLIIVNVDNTIVFANQTFANKASSTPAALVGRPVQTLPWEVDHEIWEEGQLPWDDILRGEQVASGETLTIKLTSSLDRVYKFVVNFSPITSDEGAVRGAMITFDDVTEVERKNVELQEALSKLEQGQREISRQNKALHALATRDPLTNLLNRRSLTEAFESVLHAAKQTGEQLACLVVDIDHFKTVNDTFGHSVGDIVIKSIADVLSQSSRSNDIVGRFGGEEFCLVLPEADSVIAFGIAERIRIAVEVREVPELENQRNITVSIGVTDISQGATNVSMMFDQADKALYVAKESGRNRVVRWPMDMNKDTGSELSAMAIAKTEVLDDESEAETNDLPAQAAKGASTKKKRKAPRSRPIAWSVSQSDQLNINRSLLVDRIHQAILRSARNKTTIAVMAVQFDITQYLDEELSLSLADKLEKIVTQRLREALRSTDTVAVSDEKEGEKDMLFSVLSTGVREVIVLLTDLQDFDMVPVILRRLISATKSPIVLDGIEFFMDMDVGVSLYPVDSDDGNILLNNARGAMREAKKLAGSNNWQFYSAEINHASMRQRRMESKLHVALERGEFLAHYQPKVCLKRGTIVGAEALLRWESPELGSVPPNEFISLAEQTDLIDKVTLRLVATACDQIIDWKKAGYGDLSIAVNLSPVQFRNTEIAGEIISQVSESGVSPELIEFEITENVVVQNMKTAIDMLAELSGAGFTVAIDDFGVGYSTFGYLNNFPIDCVKIDRSFIADLESRPTASAIINSTIALAQSLGLNVVAEGIETEDQLRFLQDLGCNHAQGYLFSKAVPAEEMSKLLAHPAEIRRMVLKHDQPGSEGRNSGASMFGIINQYSEGRAEAPNLAVSNPDE